MIRPLAQQQMGAEAGRWGSAIRGKLPRLAPAAAVHPRLRDRSALLRRAGLIDVFLLGRWGFRAPAAYRRADYPAVACSASLYSRQPIFDRLAIRDPSSSLRGPGQLGRVRPTTSLSIGFIGSLDDAADDAVFDRAGAVRRCRPQFLPTAHDVCQDAAEPSKSHQPVLFSTSSDAFENSVKRGQKIVFLGQNGAA